MAASALPLLKALATNSTASAFTSQIPNATEPTGDGVFKLTDAGYGHAVMVPSWVQLVPFGTDANDETFDMRLFGWNKVDGSAIWVPQLLVDISVTLGNMAGTVFAANTFMADTIAVNDGAADNGPFRSLIDAQEDLPASVLVHTRGCQYISFDFDMILAASGNCLWRPCDL